MNDILDSSELVRRLKKGSPIEVEGDVIRLPRFTEVREAHPADYGVKAKNEVIVAKARTATWCLWPLERKAKFGMKDGKHFIEIVDALQEELPQKPVKGWVLTNATIDDETKSFLEEKGHQVHRVPA